MKEAALGLSCWTLMLCGFVLVGCGSDDGLARVKGRVTLNGEPLAGATVEFHPLAPGGSSSAAKTDANGRFELMYTYRTPGAVPGEHVVTIHTAETCVGEDGREYQTEERVPARYNTQSELKRIVKPGRNTIDFDL